MRFPRPLQAACVLALAFLTAQAHAAIDRQALVRRHNPHVTSVDPWAPLSVGNGEFTYTCDVTGLQTFTAFYHDHGITTESEARWLWHENPNPKGYKLSDANRMFTAYGKTLGYPTKQSGPAGSWLRENPHLLPLPQLSLVRLGGGAAELQSADIRDIDQTLDLWTGVITSRYTVDGVPVTVTVAAAPEGESGEASGLGERGRPARNEVERGRDARAPRALMPDTVAVRIDSKLVAEGRLGVRLAIPRGHDLRTKNNPPLDWSAPESHTTKVVQESDRRLELEHTRDATRYSIGVQSTQRMRIEASAPHVFRIRAASGNVLEFTVSFAAGGQPASKAVLTPSSAWVFAASAKHWPEFWQGGGAIDFSGSKDPRANELERRVVLSQYLMAIQMAGDFPPQESGLTLNTWYGKHHTEMIWWHAAHFALWGRDDLLKRNLDWFERSLPIARAIAQERGLRGARWPKMIGPDGRESPGGNPLIVWNQPHPIHLAELLYRNHPGRELLDHYRELVQATAEAMASMLHWDEARNCYNLGPPLWIAQEIYDQATSMNPCYELSYWSRGLQIAQQWRERLGLPRDPEWDKMIKAIAPLPQKDGKYVALESTPDTWDNKDSRHDHPSFLMALGQLPGDGVDRATMGRTLDAVLATWDWETKIWGWDYPMIAMTAARLGRAQDAVNVLLKSDSPNNLYTPNGHCRQRGDLPVYLPGNGALLAAVAMMAAGWDGAPTHDAPGFPHDGSWVVHSEGLHPLP